jgi:hypothetical protein
VVAAATTPPPAAPPASPRQARTRAPLPSLSRDEFAQLHLKLFNDHIADTVRSNRLLYRSIREATRLLQSMEAGEIPPDPSRAAAAKALLRVRPLPVPSLAAPRAPRQNKRSRPSDSSGYPGYSNSHPSTSPGHSSPSAPSHPPSSPRPPAANSPSSPSTTSTPPAAPAARAESPAATDPAPTPSPTPAAAPTSDPATATIQAPPPVAATPPAPAQPSTPAADLRSQFNQIQAEVAAHQPELDRLQRHLAAATNPVDRATRRRRFEAFVKQHIAPLHQRLKSLASALSAHDLTATVYAIPTPL